MATKPSSLPRWANVLVGAIVEPSPEKKDNGWVAAEKPPAEYMNWYNNLVYQWTVWLDAFEADPHTWTAKQTYSTAGCIAITGNGTAAQAAHLLIQPSAGALPGVLVVAQGVGAGGNFTGGSSGHGVLGTGNGAGKGGVFQGGNSNGDGVTGTGGTGGRGVLGTGSGAPGVEGVVSSGAFAGVKGTGGANAPGVLGVGGSNNAGVQGTGTGGGPGVTATGGSGDGSGVTGTGGGSAGHGGDFTGAGTGPGLTATGGSGGGDGIQAARGGSSGVAIKIGTGNAQITGAQPAKNVDPGMDHFLCSTNTLKSWGALTVGNNTHTVHDGYNVNGVTINGSGGSSYAFVQFVRNMANANYSVNLTKGQYQTDPAVRNKTTSGFEIWLYQLASPGNTYDLTTASQWEVDFQVFARQ